MYRFGRLFPLKDPLAQKQIQLRAKGNGIFPNGKNHAK
jgi:hypothetical protein